MEVITPSLGVNIRDYDPKALLDGKLWRITEKIDGVRKLFYKSAHGKVTAWSRSGKEDLWLGHITKWLEQPNFPSNHIYDCELVDRDLYFSNSQSFLMRTETIAKHNQEYPDNKKDLMAICFDLFEPDGDMSSGEERTLNLSEVFIGCHLSEPMIPIAILGYMAGYDEYILSYIMALIELKRGEGLMLMSLDSPYIPGRSKELVKMKHLEEFQATIIGYDIARDDSKIAGGVAALICEVEGCTVPVRVGTGMSRDLRLSLNTDKILGSKIEIEAFGKSSNKDGEISLSMPVFKQFCGV